MKRTRRAFEGVILSGSVTTRFLPVNFRVGMMGLVCWITLSTSWLAGQESEGQKP